jgi:AcrR family transcriptional regulator
MVSQVSGQQNRGAGRVRNRRGEGSKLRGELLEAARRLLRSSDHEGELTIRAVTREAGAAPQSFYLQFASLDEILYDVYALEAEELRQVLAQAASEARDPQARLVAVCTAYCQYAQDQPGRYRAMTGVRGQPSHEGWEGRPLPGAPAFAVLLDAVSEALAAAGSAADPFLAASTLWASLHGLVSLMASRPAFPWPPLANMITTIASQCLHTPAAPADPQASQPDR